MGVAADLEEVLAPAEAAHAADDAAPMARAVIGGLITSTALTLIVVPVIYTYLEGPSAWVVSKLRRDEEDLVPAEA